MLLHCRLSNGVNRAEEFTATDAATFRAGSQRALERYYDAARTTRDNYEPVHRYDAVHGDRAVALLVQVRQIRLAGDYWLSPADVRHVAGVSNLFQWRTGASITAESFRAWPDDEWTLLWEQCCDARRWDEALFGVTRTICDAISDCVRQERAHAD